MKIKILYLYPDLMNLYGSSGNIRCLERHIKEAGAEVEVTRVTVGEEIDFSDADFVYMGAGTEKSRLRALRDLMPYKEKLKNYVNDGGIALFCGNSFEILGKKIRTTSNEDIACLNLFEYETYEEKRRVVVDTICSCRFVEGEIIGFMNKQSRTNIVASPLFRVIKGAGNAPDRNDEGIASEGLFATQLSGPILVRNPHFRSFIQVCCTTGFTSLQTYSRQ